ncbi:MAG: recombinase family protein [Armatimonadetes bacterium]|nr:recombinase family protein [Armatimonadota bacterium]
MKNVVYARKSSESEDRQVQSIEDQVAALKETAMRDGVHIDEVLTESRSAKEPYTRPVFESLVADVRRGEVGHLYTWSINRLSRNLVDGNVVAHFLQAGRLAAIRTVDRVYRPEDSVLLITLENGMSTSFIQDLRKSVRRGLGSKAAKGWAPWRAPIGYLNNRLTKQIEPDPERFHLVRKGWELMLSGAYTVNEVWQELTRLGLTSNLKGREGMPVSRTVLFQVFGNTFYAGRLQYQSATHDGKHLPMVSEAEYAAVQRALGRSPDRRKRKHDFEYSGVFRCGVCGCSIIGEAKVKRLASGAERRYTYYHCTNGKGVCDKRSVEEEAVKAAVDGAVSRIRLPQKFVDWATDELAKLASCEGETAGAGSASLSRREEAQQARLSRLHHMRLDGEVSADEYRTLKASIELELSSIRAASSLIENQGQDVLHLLNRSLSACGFAGDFLELGVMEQRARLRALGDQHFLTRGKVEIRLHPHLQKIAAFEPPEDSSGWPKSGDDLPSNSRWYSLLDGMRKIAQAELLRDGATRMETCSGVAHSNRQ